MLHPKTWRSSSYKCHHASMRIACISLKPNTKASFLSPRSCPLLHSTNSSGSQFATDCPLVSNCSLLYQWALLLRWLLSFLQEFGVRWLPSLRWELTLHSSRPSKKKAGCKLPCLTSIRILLHYAKVKILTPLDGNSDSYTCIWRMSSNDDLCPSTATALKYCLI